MNNEDIKIDVRSHPSEEWLERYALRGLTEEESESLEDHLMLCQRCQEDLESIESFLLVAREASRRVRQESAYSQTDSSFWSFFRRFSLTSLSIGGRPRIRFALPLAGAALTSLALFLVAPASQRVGYQQVRLEAIRGYLATSVNSRQPLDVILNLDGVPVSRAYRVEIVNAAGVTNAVAVVVPKGNTLIVRIKSKLPPGQYWVRLYIPGANDPLHEYSLHSD